MASASVNVHLWELGEYRDQDTQLPPLINPEWIYSQLALTTVSIGESRQKVWATIDLAKVCSLIILRKCSDIFDNSKTHHLIKIHWQGKKLQQLHNAKV